jgi:hypothetical protein
MSAFTATLVVVKVPSFNTIVAEGDSLATTGAGELLGISEGAVVKEAPVGALLLGVLDGT